jgi:TolA-binding protein
MDFSKLTPEQFKVAEMVVEAAEANKIDANLLLAQAFRESQFKQIPAQDPKSDAFGVMQIRPSTAELNKLGDITDLRTNIFGGAKLMRQYLDKYKSPEAALLAYHQGPGVADTYIKSGGDLKSVGPKGLDYVINIGENGGFGQPTNAEGEEGSPKLASPFENYESESSKFKREQEEAERNKSPTIANPDDKQGGISAPEMGAIAGAGINALLPMFTDPKVSPKIDTSKAEEAYRVARDKVEVARQNLEHYAPSGVDELENQFNQTKQELERLKNEQRLAQEQLKQKLPTSIVPASMDIPESVEIPSRTKAGDSGAVNYVRAMSDDVPEVLANQALNMRKDNPRGGQAIIDANALAIQKQADLGLGDFSLARTAGGVQLALPPTTVAERQADEAKKAEERNAELTKRAEETRLQQEELNAQNEGTRLYREYELERLRQERAQQGARLNILSEQRKITNPIVRQVTKAQSDAEVARRRLERAGDQPSTLTRPLESVGVGTAKMGVVPRTLIGGGAGFAGVMSYQEALARFKAGDTSEGVLQALQAGSVGMAMLPPAGKGLTKARGAGAIAAVPLYGYELGRRLLKDSPEE